MTATAVPITTWQGCYGDSWQDLICPEAFAHPAKFARGLIHRIYRHLLEQGYVREGDSVLDPFGGVGLGAIDAMTYGLHWIGCELEPRFVTLAQQNLALWRQRYGFTGGTVVQGDSRRLREVLAGAEVGCCVSSPPYAGAGEVLGTHNGIDWSKTQEGGKVATPARQASGEGYGTTPGQLGAMPPGVVVGSPPYEALPVNDNQRFSRTSRDSQCLDGPTPYGTSPAQLGNTAGDTFWAASAQIMAELAALLPPGAVCAWVLKAYVSQKAIVPFPDQWRALCEAHGFETREIIHASLIEEQGTQATLFGSEERLFTKKASFFRRLAEKRGSPSIDYEVILIMVKASL